MAGKRILIVEDNAVNRQLLQRVLQIRGYETLGAERGDGIVESVRELMPDMILMDMHLPGMDGLEATRRLKAEHDTRAIPVVMVTTNGLDGTLEQARAAGCTDFLQKPLDFDELDAVLQRVCQD